MSAMGERESSVNVTLTLRDASFSADRETEYEAKGPKLVKLTNLCLVFFLV